MKALFIPCLFAILGAAAAAQTTPPDDGSLLKPDSPSYSEAVKFAKVLDRAGIRVNKIARSKLEGFFRGVERAAYYKTDKGVIEAIFFSGDGAEKIQVTETTDGQRYFYSFTGQPEPRPPGDSFNSSKPMYFIAHGDAFVVIWGDKELFETLKAGLNRN